LIIIAYTKIDNDSEYIEYISKSNGVKIIFQKMRIRKQQALANINQKTLIFLVLALALTVRLVHLASSATNPMTYHPGADESFYLSFGKDVAQGQFGLSAQYIFMDPLYGYLIGFFSWLIGQNLFVIYFFQIIVDVFTVWLVYTIAKVLWNHRAGLIAAVFYALTSTAIFYTTTILKSTIVANYIALWILLAIRVPQTKSLIIWLGYGIFLGLGVALRSNLLLLSIASFFIIPLIHIQNFSKNSLSIRIVLLVVGFSLPSLMLAGRNGYIANHWSMLPPNSGIVLHQLYNPNNPESIHFVPNFVSYRSPPEILAGYTIEAENRLGQQLSAYEVSDFWRKQAFTYIASNPGKIFENLLRKSKKFIDFKETGDNRFFNEEALFSPILTFLPQPFGWLFALGLPGLILLTLRNRILSLPIIIAVVSVFATFVIFIATARFRAHGLPLFAVGTGVFITAVIDWKNIGKYIIVSAIIFSLFLGTLTLWSEKQIKREPGNLMAFAWGFVKMNQPEQAKHYASQQIKINPGNAGPYELLGYLALNARHYQQAILLFAYATQLAPQHHIAHYNLALSLSKTKQFSQSLVAIESAINITALPEYLLLKGQILEQIGIGP